MIDLKEVTLIAVSGIKIPETIQALRASCRDINFGAVKLISDQSLVDLPSPILLEPAKFPLDSIDAYNRYMIYELHNHVATPFCLVVQYDGFVLRPELWDPEFLKFDYIGAPWPLRRNAYIDPFGKHIRIGNGGFSLRSRKLLLVPTIRDIPFDVNQGNFYRHMNAGFFSEDGNICVHNRHLFEAEGCVFAPIEVAVKFSQEIVVKEGRGIISFGFHKHNPPLKVGMKLKTLAFLKRVLLGKQ